MKMPEQTAEVGRKTEKPPGNDNETSSSRTASKKGSVFSHRKRGGGTVLSAFSTINLSLLFSICSIIMEYSIIPR